MHASDNGHMSTVETLLQHTNVKGNYDGLTALDFARHRRIEHYGPITGQVGVEIPED